jgi:hypothetical protein
VPTTPTQIRIPPDVKERAKAKARAEDATLSEVVIRLLREYIAGPPPEQGDES